MATSNKNPTHRIRAALLLRRLSIPQIARKHGANVKTCYAVLNGTRSGTQSPEAARAVAEINLLTKGVRDGR